MIMEMKLLRKRISDRMHEKRIKVAELARISGVKDPTLRKFLDGSTDSIGYDKVVSIARALGLEALEFSDQSSDALTFEASVPARPPAAAVPIIGVSAANFASGKLLVENQPIGAVPCPPALTQARDLYAFYVSGDAMEPEHRNGDLRFASPHMPSRINDTVAIHETTSDGKVYLSLGHYLGNTADTVKIGRLMPQGEAIEIKKEVISKMDKVLSIREMFGA